MVNFEFWNKWLLIVGYLIVIVGAIFSLSGLVGAHVPFIVDSFFYMGEVPADVVPFMDFMVAILGSAMIAFGLVVVNLAHHSFTKKEPWAWKALLTSFTAWFVIDTLFATYYSVYTLVLMNLVFYAAMVAPLFFTRPEFVPHGKKKK